VDVDTRAALALIAGMAFATYATRVPLVVLVTSRIKLPPLLEHILRCIPTATFAAIVVPGVLQPEQGQTDLSPSNLYIYAAAVSVVSLRLSRNLLVTILVGCATALALSLLF
jgi:branched-subunit amino acid transport protein